MSSPNSQRGALLAGHIRKAVKEAIITEKLKLSQPKWIEEYKDFCKKSKINANKGNSLKLYKYRGKDN